MRTSTCLSKYKAFSLVEVVVALGILTVGVFGVMELFVASRSVTIDGAQRARAAAAARGIVETLRAAGPEAVAELYGNQTLEADGTAVWPSTPAPLDDDSTAYQVRLAPVEGKPDVLEIEVAVAWRKAALDPLSAGPGESTHVVGWLPIRQ